MRSIVRSLDAVIRRQAGVYEFTQDPACILRLQRSRLHHTLDLPDAHLGLGTPVLEFHLWNERVPLLPPGGADLAWARDTSRRLTRSFRMVRTHLVTELAPAGFRAVGGITILGAASGASSDVLAHLGFHPFPCHNALGRFGEVWENAYTWTLMWTYNPRSLRGKRLSQSRRMEYWMSTPAFLERFVS